MNAAAVPLAHLSRATIAVSAVALDLSERAGPGAAKVAFVTPTIAAGIARDAGNAAPLTATGARAAGSKAAAGREPRVPETVMWAVGRAPSDADLRQDGSKATFAGLAATTRRETCYRHGAQTPAGESVLRQGFHGPQNLPSRRNPHAAGGRSHIGRIMGAAVPASPFEAGFAAQSAGKAAWDHDGILPRRITDPGRRFVMEAMTVDAQKPGDRSGQDDALLRRAFFPASKRGCP